MNVNKLNITFNAGIVILLSLCASCVIGNKKNGYEGDLVPIKKEIDNIEGYEQATQMILKNWDRIDDEMLHPKEPEPKVYERSKSSKNSIMDSILKEHKSYKYRAYSIIDSILQIEEDSLKLRFFGYDMQVEGKDTLVKFEPRAGDYYMRGNNKNAYYTLFKHYIYYNTKPMETYQNKGGDDDTPSAIFKIKDKYYYIITSHLEY